MRADLRLRFGLRTCRARTAGELQVSLERKSVLQAIGYPYVEELAAENVWLARCAPWKFCAARCVVVCMRVGCVYCTVATRSKGVSLLKIAF